MACRRCHARADAHFGWCEAVGGRGHHPSLTKLAVATATRPETPRGAAGPRNERHGRTGGLQLVPSKPLIEPGVNIVRAAEKAPPRLPQWTKTYAGAPDWEKIDPAATAQEIFETCRRGLPRAIRISFHPEVLALQGLNIAQVEAAVREPQFVEPRPETVENKYPILGFRRGDIFVILGMRTPVTPMVIAAYWDALLEHDTYRRPEAAGGTGGGGKRKAPGLPKTVKASIMAMRSHGAYVPADWETADKVTVTYRGTELGKISCRNPERQLIQSDYQRCVRKMHAIDRREEASA